MQASLLCECVYAHNYIHAHRQTHQKKNNKYHIVITLVLSGITRKRKCFETIHGAHQVVIRLPMVPFQDVCYLSFLSPSFDFQKCTSHAVPLFLISLIVCQLYTTYIDRTHLIPGSLTAGLLLAWTSLCKLSLPLRLVFLSLQPSAVKSRLSKSPPIFGHQFE